MVRAGRRELEHPCRALTRDPRASREAGDVRWLVEFDIDGEDAALQSPANANGMDRALAALGSRLNAKLDLQLERAAVGSSRVVWSR